MRIKNIVLLIATVLLTIVAFSQQENAASITGTVTDARTKMPMPEAVVTLKSNSFEGEKYTLTDSSGSYRINNLPAGVYHITFEMEGYGKSSKDSIIVSQGISLAVNYELMKERRKRGSQLKVGKGTKNTKINPKNSI